MLGLDQELLEPIGTGTPRPEQSRLRVGGQVLILRLAAAGAAYGRSGRLPSPGQNPAFSHASARGDCQRAYCRPDPN